MAVTPLRLSSEDHRRVLHALETASPSRASRARCLLFAHEGLPDDEIGRRLGVAPEVVGDWLDAYATQGIRRLLGARGRKRVDPTARVDRVRAAMRELERAPEGVSVRRVAEIAELPITTTYRIMRELEPGSPAARVEPGPPDIPARERILVIGCGDAGTHTIQRLREIGLRGAAALALNVETSRLDGSVMDLASRVGDASLVFLTLGLGGHTGVTNALALTQAAKARGALVVGIASMPFHMERLRSAKAETDFDALRAVVDTLVVLENERLVQYVPNLPIGQAFRVMDTLIAETLRGIVETLTQPAILSLDDAAMRAALGGPGTGALFYGESRSNDPERVVLDALRHPFHQTEVSAATGALIHVSGGVGLSLATAQAVVEGIGRELRPGANIAWGARVAPELGSKLRLVVILKTAPDPTR